MDIDASDIAASLENVDLAGPELKNAPATLDEAIARIMVLEQALDNVCYTMDIAKVTGNYDHARPYVDNGLELLQDRIVEVEQDTPEMRVTIVEGKLDADTAKNIVSKSTSTSE
jgi:hypothetical protein